MNVDPTKMVCEECGHSESEHREANGACSMKSEETEEVCKCQGFKPKAI